MGWHGGSSIILSMANGLLLAKTPPDGRRTAYRATIPGLDRQDYNDHPDVVGVDPILDEVIYEMHGDRWGMEIYPNDMSNVQPAKWHWGRHYFPDDPKYDEVEDGSGAIEDHEARKRGERVGWNEDE